jgi:predicted short-subunit dehydrogenase-like oxidoreductase (DUF2520 family)
MNVAIIGSGNVASILGRLITTCGHTIIHVASRNPEHAAVLAKQFQTAHSGYDGIGSFNADIFIIAVADAAISECISGLPKSDRLFVHTAGSVSKDVLQGISSRYGVMYPLQSLRKEMEVIPSIPLLVDGNTEEVTAEIENFAKSLTAHVERTDDTQRLKLHAAAVIVSNFTNHLYSLAEQFCIKENVSFDLLKPLITETAQRIITASPSDVQTGPAVRKDIQTLDKHLRLLSDHPKLRYLYLKLTDSIIHA